MGNIRTANSLQLQAIRLQKWEKEDYKKITGIYFHLLLQQLKHVEICIFGQCLCGRHLIVFLK